MLTEQDIALLEKPFELDEHGFRDGNTPDDGKPYIHRLALKHRLDSIDRGWKLSPNLRDIQIINDVVAIPGTLTIKGVEQENVSTAIIQRFDKDGVEVKPYTLAQNTVLAIKSATSGLLQRCLQSFGCGMYLKSQAFKGIKTRAALKLAIDKLATPVHWAHGDGGKRINALMTELKLDGAAIKEALEPGKTLTKMSETTLNETQVILRLLEIATEKKAQPTNGDSLRQSEHRSEG